MKPIPISSLRLDGGTQQREHSDEQTIQDYADAMQAGATFPPIVAYSDGVDNWLADGFHRVYAAQRAKLKEIVADVRRGGQREAILFAVGANGTNGLRRTNADKRKAVMTLLADKEWAKWSDRKIAEACGVHHEMVGNARRSLSESASDTIPPLSAADEVKIQSIIHDLSIDIISRDEANERIAEIDPHWSKRAGQQQRTYTTKHGTTATMNTAKIGNRPNHWTLARQRAEGVTIDDMDEDQEPTSETVVVNKQTGEVMDVQDVEVVTTKVRPLNKVSDAMTFAGMAISQLERIATSDPHRANAFEYVAQWIRSNIDR